MKTSTIIKIAVITLCFILVLISSILAVKYISNMFTTFQAVTIEYANGIASTRIEENNKVLQKRIAELDETIVKILNDKNKKATDIGYSISQLNATVKKQMQSDHSYKPESKDPNEQVFKLVYMKDVIGKEIPIAWAIYYPNKKEWKTGIVPGWNLKSQVVLTDGKEKDAIFNVWLENKLREDTKGNKYPLKVVQTEWIRRETKTKEFMFNPRLSLGINADIEGVVPSADISLFSYGLSKGDMNWRFLEIGVSGVDDLHFNFTPFSYNIAKQLPLIENLFIGGFIGSDMFLNINGGLKISVPF